ncbi:hypothetical protein [Thermospira aquatica]|uniref:Uncharacterized protein n=1 Tax=Thermospira aquatica TaxID=2828656 RepID=A0AAX3BGQ7_9SPIR|nr:hypothetical protein [Thermospira aquatica]URA10636.1 hypothetical protein KDW03_02185 [Thermospira aquatica]
MTSTIIKFTQKASTGFRGILNKTIMEDGTETLPDRYKLVNVRVLK